MGLFKKTKKEAKPSLASLPEMPRLPSLPSAPSANSKNSKNDAPRPNALPRFPSGSLGEKFSQNTIKDAVSGEKEEDAVDEFEKEIQRMPQLPARPMARESSLSEKESPRYKRSSVEESTDYPETRYADQKKEPVFVRLDKFEESMDIFQKVKKQMAGAEKFLEDLKELKEREDQELEEWQEKLESMKDQVEKIDREIFSKVE